jgi:hypothetical protein
MAENEDILLFVDFVDEYPESNKRQILDRAKVAKPFEDYDKKFKERFHPSKSTVLQLLISVSI